MRLCRIERTTLACSYLQNSLYLPEGELRETTEGNGPLGPALSVATTRTAVHCQALVRAIISGNHVPEHESLQPSVTMVTWIYVVGVHLHSTPIDGHNLRVRRRTSILKSRRYGTVTWPKTALYLETARPGGSRHQRTGRRVLTERSK